jgi:hypothetical protein
VRDALADGEWHTLADLALATGDPEASISTRIRDLRLPQYGGHDVVSHRRPDRVFEYRLVGVPRALSDLGREYIAAVRTCQKYQAAAEALRRAHELMEAADAAVSRLESVEAARAAMWAERERWYRRSMELAEKTTERDLTDGTER